MGKRFYITIIFTSIVWFLLPVEAVSQRRASGFKNLQHYDHRLYNFGFSLGLNKMNFALKPNYEEPGFNYTLPEHDFGFHIGIVSNLNLARLWDLRFIPTLSFGDRYIYYHDTDDWTVPDNAGAFDPTLLEFPLHLKFKSERIYDNVRVYVIGGFKYSYDLASVQEVTGEEILVRVAKNDFHYEMGFGVEYHFYYFRMSTEIKGSFGMLNLARPGSGNQVFYSTIDRLNSKSIMISFLFE